MNDGDDNQPAMSIAMAGLEACQDVSSGANASAVLPL